MRLISSIRATMSDFSSPPTKAASRTSSRRRRSATSPRCGCLRDRATCSCSRSGQARFRSCSSPPQPCTHHLPRSLCLSLTGLSERSSTAEVTDKFFKSLEEITDGFFDTQTGNVRQCQTCQRSRGASLVSLSSLLIFQATLTIARLAVHDWSPQDIFESAMEPAMARVRKAMRRGDTEGAFAELMSMSRVDPDAWAIDNEVWMETDFPKFFYGERRSTRALPCHTVFLYCLSVFRRAQPPLTLPPSLGRFVVAMQPFFPLSRVQRSLALDPRPPGAADRRPREPLGRAERRLPAYRPRAKLRRGPEAAPHAVAGGEAEGLQPPT